MHINSASACLSVSAHQLGDVFVLVFFSPSIQMGTKVLSGWPLSLSLSSWEGINEEIHVLLKSLAPWKLIIKGPL